PEWIINCCENINLNLENENTKYEANKICFEANLSSFKSINSINVTKCEQTEKIICQDKEINLYTKENMKKNSFFHFHDGKDQENVVHFEGKRGTLASFLETINTYSLEDCIKKQYEKKESLYYFWINGQPSDLNYGEYVVNDLDKLLFKCGNEPPTQEQINSIGNFACIQSKKC
ncbi:MAG: hypothetical protein AABX84_02155, partial [Nanoarchaeota archaeon]